MDKPKQMIVVRRDLKMRKGKIAAQAGHACVTAVLAALEREASAVRAGLSGHETRLAILEMGGRTNGVVRPEH